MIGEQMEHMTNANKDKQIKRKIEASPVLEHRLQHLSLDELLDVSLVQMAETTVPERFI